MSDTVSATRPVQRRTLGLLALAQVFSGLATGSALSIGSILATDLSGSDAWAGSVTTTVTLGAAIVSALLVRLAVARGRRVALSTGLVVAFLGAMLMIVAVTTRQFWLLLLAALLVGAGTSVNLQARFAGTDLSEPAHRGRDLSLVVWMSTIGSVAGPNLVAPGQALAGSLGLPALTGIFVISSTAMLLAFLVVWIGLRPDPLLVAREQGRAGAAARAGLRVGLAALRDSPRAGGALVTMLVAHFTMVAVMATTPVHLTMHGATITVVGITISLHIAGMYALSPVMGLLADRFGGSRIGLAGLGALVVAVLLAGFSGERHVVTTVGLVLLGLGWSAATVSASATIVGAVPGESRVAAQGVADTLMSLAGALGGLASGLAFAVIGFAGLGVGTAAICAAAAAVVLLRARRVAA